MARSYRHTPIFAITGCKSEKTDKRLANRKLRHLQVRAADRGAEVLPLLREVSNVWGFGKDGRRYDRAAGGREMRK